MGLRVKDRRESECLLLTSKIELALNTATLAHAKAGRILWGALLRKKERNLIMEESKIWPSVN